MLKKNIILIIILSLSLLTACAKSDIKEAISEENINNTLTSEAEASPTEPDANPSESESKTQEPAQNDGDSEVYEPYIWPDFTLKALDGSTAQLYDFKDKIIVINFWATWCTYCEKEMPLIEALSKNDKYYVLAIDVGEDAETVNKYLESQGLSLNVYLDEDQTLASQFNVTGFPTSVFLGPDFEYLYAYPGMLEQTTLDCILKSIDEYLAQ